MKISKYIASTILAISVLLTSGCATVFSDNTSLVLINSTPSGADIYSYPDNKLIGTTPAQVTASPKNRFFILKKDGYKAKPIALGLGTNKATYFNHAFAVFYPISNTVDNITRSKFVVKESQINVELDKQ
ncbi:PEGA domain-containing protein [Pectobacterium versatile]|uniref:PEGA domain-containing protein n=1 Tax=Pectobacterium versatile TaxID=2488639 RepID=UPI001F1A41ED|nr:PEGA domain-containing protein [Pectobacterium versatile]